jgi:hypothetical protein
MTEPPHDTSNSARRRASRVAATAYTWGDGVDVKTRLPVARAYTLTLVIVSTNEVVMTARSELMLHDTARMLPSGPNSPT